MKALVDTGRCPTVDVHNNGKAVKALVDTGRCPTVDVHNNGKAVKALVDTGSEVTTVTERWVQENLQHADLKA